MKFSLLAGAAVAALLLSGCAGAQGGAPEPVGEVTGAGVVSQEAPAAEPAATEVATEAPEGGAAVRLGDIEQAIERVGCTSVNDNWSMSGSVDDGAKVAVMTTGDRQTVISASVVLADGKLVQMDSELGQGEATITWDGDWFTVVGSGPYFDLMDAEVTGDEEQSFVVKASCPA